MPSVTLRVGLWSATLDSDAPYYNTLFSPLREAGVEIPSELVYDWEWLPKQWPIWMLLATRMTQYKSDWVPYLDPPIYYRDIEILHRALLDLPDAWQPFVVFDTEPMSEVLWNNLAISGRLTPPLRSNSSIAHPMDIISSFITELGRYTKAHDELLSKTDSDTLRSRRLAYHGRSEVDELEKQVVLPSESLSDRIMSRAMGLWQNERLCSMTMSYSSKAWSHLMSLWSEVYEGLYILEGNPPPTVLSQSQHMIRAVQYNDMAFILGIYKPYYHLGVTREHRTSSSSFMTSNVQNELHPLLYQLSLDSFHENGDTVLGLTAFAWDPCVLKSWCYTVHISILSATKEVVAERNKGWGGLRVKMISAAQGVALLGVVGRTNAVKLATIMHGIAKKDKRHARSLAMQAMSDSIMEHKDHPCFTDTVRDSFSDELIGSILDNFPKICR